jgi:cytochrome c oxidase subunit II
MISFVSLQIVLAIWKPPLDYYACGDAEVPRTAPLCLISRARKTSIVQADVLPNLGPLLYDDVFPIAMKSSRVRFAGAAERDRAVRATNRARGSAPPAVLMALLLALLVAATVYMFAAHLYPAPPPITSAAVVVDRQYNLTLYVAGAIFILAQLGLAYAVVRFRDRGQSAHFTHGNAGFEVLWASLTVLAFLFLAIMGRKAWADVRFTPAGSDAIQVEATTNQFVYTFRYPGPDGKFGMLAPNLVNAPAGNPLGLDPRDSAGRDDIVVPELTVPVNRPIELLLRSQDVIHNFFVRELRLQQDAVPAMVIPVHFTPNRVGTYEIVCTQLCGLGHYKMHSLMYVVSEPDYESFLKRQAPIQ